jgi:hypothetical protein
MSSVVTRRAFAYLLHFVYSGSVNKAEDLSVMVG